MSSQGWQAFEERLEAPWDDFVESHPQGRFIHLIGFKKTVESVYGLKPSYLLHTHNDRIQAVFPSFFHRGLLYGKRLVSQPFSEYGGILFSPGLDSIQRLQILDEFRGVIEESRERESFDYLEVRCFPDLQGLGAGRLAEVRLHSYAVLLLAKGMDLSERVDYSVRKNVRKARRHGLTIRFGAAGDDIEDVFYPLHLRTLKRLGSPPHPLEYFLTLKKNLGGRMLIAHARYEGKTVSVLLGWAVGDSVHITDIASDEKFFYLRANDFIHYEFIEWAAAGGYRCFDFGPVRYTGQRQYKEKWGVQLHDYSYYYLPADKAGTPLFERSSLTKLGSSLWRLAVPLNISARVGKYLRKELSL